MPRTYKWTVIALIQSIEDNHNNSFYQMLNGQILKLTPSPDIKLCLVVNKNNTVKGERVPYVRIYDISVDEKTRKFKKTKTSLGKIKLDDAGNLGSVFDLIKKNSPAEKYMLLIWGHGIGFGFFDGEIDSSDFDKIAFKEKEQPKTFRRYIQVINKQINYDPLADFKEGETKLLTPDHLSKALHHTFGEYGIEVIVTMSCCMQNLYTAFSLRKNARFLVGAETLMLFSGYNYHDAINSVIENFNISSRELAIVWIKSLRRIYSTTERRKAYADILVSAIDLRAIEKLFPKLKVLWEKLSKNFDRCSDAYADVLEKCVDVSNTTDEPISLFMVDILQLFKLMVAKTEINKIVNQELADIIDYMEKKVILEIYPGENIEKAGSLHGLSVYHPADLYKYYSDYYYTFSQTGKTYTTSFCQRTRWGVFLEQFLVKTKELSISLP